MFLNNFIVDVKRNGLYQLSSKCSETAPDPSSSSPSSKQSSMDMASQLLKMTCTNLKSKDLDDMNMPTLSLDPTASMPPLLIKQVLGLSEKALLLYQKLK